jgi:hypothetical protein
LARDRIAALTGEKTPAPAISGSPVGRTTDIQPILLPASSVDLKRSRDIEVGGSLAGQYGANVLHNAPPYGPRPNAAEWAFFAPAAGRYRLDIEFAAQEARPVRILINGKAVRADALNETTGGWSEANQRFSTQGFYDLRTGENRIRLERSNVFPHIRALRFVP